MSDSRTVTPKAVVRRRRPSTFVLACLALALVSCGTGCQAWMKPPALANPMNWFKKPSTEEKHGVPQRLVVLWADDVIGQTGKPSTRGFGGRLYFYNADDKPIPVEGQLTIYGYDDTIPKKGSQRNPDRKFVFTAEQFQSHFSESQIGPSYSVWIPWEDIDGPRRDVSLVPVFITSSGKVIMGPQTINVLAARTPEGEAKYNQLRLSHKTQHGPLAQASHLEPAAGGSSAATGAAGQPGDPSASPAALEPDRPNRLGLRTSTIPLNGSMSERLRTAPPMPPIGVGAPAATTSPTTTGPGAGGSAWGTMPAGGVSAGGVTAGGVSTGGGTPPNAVGDAFGKPSGTPVSPVRPGWTPPAGVVPPSNRLLSPPGFSSGNGPATGQAPMHRLPPAAAAAH